MLPGAEILILCLTSNQLLMRILANTVSLKISASFIVISDLPHGVRRLRKGDADVNYPKSLRNYGGSGERFEQLT
jgi:hypothetical protein